MGTREVVMAEDAVEQRWTDVLHSLETHRPYTLAPWQPLEGEPQIAQLAFASYRDSPQRNLALTASVMALPFDDIKDFAHLYEWVRRAECFDMWRERAADDARAEALAKVALETTTTFARLPVLAGSAFQLVEGAVNAKLAQQAKIAKSGRSLNHDEYSEDADEDLKPMSITMALNIAGMVRGLLAEANRFLGLKVTVEHSHRGMVGHVLVAPTDAMVTTFLEGLAEANYDVGPAAIEATSS